jgi:ankyrin repeat protein
MIKSGATLEELRASLQGSSVNKLQEIVNNPDSAEQLPLHAALKKDRMDVTEWLLALGANTESQNYWGKTAKEIAESKHSDEALKLVLLYGPRS